MVITYLRYMIEQFTITQEQFAIPEKQLRDTATSFSVSVVVSSATFSGVVVVE